MPGELMTNPAGILRGIQVVRGSGDFMAELGTDDFLKAWPVKAGEIEHILFRPHAWLRAAVPEWYANIALSDQITVIFSYPDLPALATVTPFVEVVRERPLVTVRCPPSSAIMRDLRLRPALDPTGQLDLVLYKEARLAYGHYEISDRQGEIQKVILALVADPKSYIDAIGAANVDPRIKFRAAESIQEIRFICQFKSGQPTATASGPNDAPDPKPEDLPGDAPPDEKPDDMPDDDPDDTPELPSCTMFTGTFDPDDSEPGGGTVTVDTIWAADWPPQPDPDPDPTPPSP